MAEEKKLSVKKRIVKISNELRLEKGGLNEFIKHSYFRPDDILQAINPLLDKYNLITIFNMDFLKDREVYKGILRVVDCDSEENVCYRFEIPPTEVKGASKTQNAGATQTYCKRYIMMNAFNIAVDKDDPDNKRPNNEVGQDMIEKIKKAISSCDDIMQLQDQKDKIGKSKNYKSKDKKDILTLIEKKINALKTS